MTEIFLSICIPSYNRPQQLYVLLESIDCSSCEIEVVICEDCAPNRLAVRSAVNNFKKISTYEVNYFENSTNLGFDGNLRKLVECAKGKYILFMGDDDLFVPNALDNFIFFLKQNSNRPYILRSYLSHHPDGTIEYFKYMPKSIGLSSGEGTVAWLFKRSVTICGFTISRELATYYATNKLDGTLLYQVYLMAQVCLKHDSIYCDIIVSQMIQSFRNDETMFGSSIAEMGRFTPGIVSHDNSINFTKAYFEVTGYIDNIHGTKLTELVRIDLSKYSYPFLSIQRKRGILSFLNYTKRLDKETKLGCTFYFHFYKWSLIIFGEVICDKMIVFIKNRFGYTPIL
jgi:abequosyltransferase